jgi:DUF4097 and DUF4098 domain-containing protein YvlB
MFEFFSNKSIKVSKSKIIIDGVDVTPKSDDKRITIVINGSPSSVHVDVCESLTINGDVKDVESSVGNITINGNVSGDVETGSGDIKCGNVSGDVETGTGDIDCENVQGDVETGTGDIKYKK